MPCEQYREQIQAFVDGMLSEEETAALRDHCMHCRDCAVYLREMDALQRSLQALGEEPVPAGLHEKIMAAYRQEKARPAKQEMTEARQAAERQSMPEGQTREAPVQARQPAAEKRVVHVNFRPTLAAAAAVVVLVGAVIAAGSLRRGRTQNVADPGELVDIEDNAVPQGSFAGTAATTAGATTAGATTAAATTAAATTAAPTAATTANLTTARPTEPTAPTMDPEARKAAREEAEKMIPAEIAPEAPYGFVHVLRAEAIPLEFTDWEAESIRYQGEKMTCAYAVLPAARIEEIVKAAEADWAYFCDNPEVWDALTPGEKNGLLMVIVPEGT